MISAGLSITFTSTASASSWIGCRRIFHVTNMHWPRFDGTSLYEYHDQWKAEHQDWGTLIFNYERHEVRSFLISSALYWLNEFHIDGLRVDAVASMLYLNFSRQADDWVPNRLGGSQNLEAVEFVCALNDAVERESPGCLMIAEESTDWQGVTHPTSAGGLGFHLKWNMGWMHDTLDYFAKDPIHRKHHQDWLTFGPTYAFDEHFLLPLSHDEVVHLKRSLLGKMPGDEWQQLANLRLLFTYQWAFPGKKLMFMGGEMAQTGEWSVAGELPWERLQQAGPRGIAALLTELNHVMKALPALGQWDGDKRGFEWINGDDAERSVISFMRHGEDSARAGHCGAQFYPRGAAPTTRLECPTPGYIGKSSIRTPPGLAAAALEIPALSKAKARPVTGAATVSG